MQRRRNVPDHSRPAAFLAVEMRPSTVVGGACADATPTPKTKTNMPTAITSANDFILYPPKLDTLFNERQIGHKKAQVFVPLCGYFRFLGKAYCLAGASADGP